MIIAVCILAYFVVTLTAALIVCPVSAVMACHSQSGTSNYTAARKEKERRSKEE